MDVSPELYTTVKRIASRSRLVSQPEVLRELQLGATESEAVLEELIARGLLRRVESSKGATYFWISADPLPED